MIEKCSVCNTDVSTFFILPFFELLGSDDEIYNQSIAVCEKCGFIFTRNPFTEDQLRNRYASNSKFEYDSQHYLGGIRELYKKQCHKQKRFIDDVLGRDAYKSVFEIGCASGYNLSLYNTEKRYGIEPSPFNCELAKKNYGVELFNGMWSDYYNGNSFQHYDLLILSMVLEHIVKPREFLFQCECLSPNYVFIEVPTIDYKFVNEPFGMFCEEHVNIFTIENLSVLMKSLGYELTDCEMVFNQKAYLPAGYPSIMTLFQKKKDAYICQSVFSSKDLLDNYIKKCEVALKEIEYKINMIPSDKKIAVWGVGHHISMLLANTSLKKKNIVRIYDSDNRKHGIKFLGNKIKGFDKKDVIDNQVEGILITTYTAQKAILEELSDLSLKVDVYTLYEL